ncbi:MAG: protein kinase [Anaerolineales bacterium]|nr:protein kinase [Anaerolineales bacterium]
MLPKNIGKYRILDKVGAGGMAVVYLGQEEVFERQVAVKVLPSHLGQDPDNRERFRREAKAIASLEHAAVVPVYDYGQDGEQLFLVMRYMQGGSLKDRLTHGRIPLPAAATIIRRVASALDKAHSMGMIHRDIKPGNILFDLEDNPYITDFGLVKMVESSVQLTHSEFFGTPAYTSPEQCQGDKEIDGRADVYSLTAMFFHMVTGNPPYESNNAMALLMKHVADPIPQLAATAPDLPAALQKVIERGMAKLPADRYATTGEMAKDVDRAASGAPEPARPQAPVGWGSSSASAPATESAPPVSFESLRASRAGEPARGEDMPTRKDSFAPGKIPAAAGSAFPEMSDDSEATNALDFRAIPTERRRLEWTPQADSTPLPPAGSAAPAVSPFATTKPAASYTEPPKPLEKKASGIPILVFVVFILIISLVYFAAQKGLF